MNFVSRQPIAAIVCFAGALLIGASAIAQAPAPGQPLPLDFQALERGKEALNAQKYPDAVKAFQEVLSKYPQSPAVPEATFRMGYAYYLLGDYDKSVANFQKVPVTKGAAPEMIELATSLTPQVLATKASKLKPEDPLRDSTLLDAIRQFDVFLQKFPQSEEGESANFGKAIAFFQLKKYEEAVQALRTNLTKFAQSESIQDSQYTLALVLGADGVDALQKATAPDPAAIAKLDEGEKVLRDIIGKGVNLAVVNDAQFQLGEMLTARGTFTDAEKQKELRTTIFKKALEAYRGVSTKEQVIAAQKKRIDNISLRRVDAGKQANVQLFRRLQRLQEKEQEKLAAFEERGDQTVTAKIKSGQIFFQLGKLDESRVLLTFVEPLAAEDPEAKKTTLYFITMSYALQNVMEKAVERYNAFQAAYKADPIAENLQLVMAAGFLNKDPKIFNPEKAIEYCKEGLQVYPKGRFTSDLLNVQAGALIGLKRYDEALALLQQFIASNPPKELAAEAEFNLAIIYKDTGKTDDAVKTFRSIRDKYADSVQAEQASYWVGELGLTTDPKTAVTELKAFMSKHSDSELMPQAMFALGRGQAALNQKDDAIITFRDLPKKYPTSQPAPYAFFERAKIFAEREKYDECLAIMKEFVAAYPESDALYQAHDFMAQILTNQKKGMEAIEVYEDFVKKRPSEPAAAEALLKISSLWKGYAEGQGPYLSLPADKRAEWTKGNENSISTAERILDKYPESPAVALALTNLLEIQKTRVKAKLPGMDVAAVEAYFDGLAKKAEGKPDTQSKIQMTLASFIAEVDKPKAALQMDKNYKPDLKYAPGDIDLYGQTLIETKEYDKALKVYEKLAKDYPIPGGAEPNKAPKAVQEAQATALVGQGQALQGKGEKEAGGKKFQEVEQLYAWTPKMMEVHYGIALAHYEAKTDEEDALRRLLEIIRAPKAPAPLRANAMLLLGKIHENGQRYDMAIDNYIKIATFYGGVKEVAAEGLWRGAQLLERQGRGELPRPVPPPKASPAPKASPGPKGSPAPPASPKAGTPAATPEKKA
ncbi:MAG: hypothetical protein QOE70_6839 [Chthoniobacter sp.]|jgi:TolA-binding protein|nr:hypothetical protein [Chthoniobacter sp.]